MIIVTLLRTQTPTVVIYSLDLLHSQQGPELAHPDSHHLLHVQRDVDRELDVLLLLTQIVVDVDPAPAWEEEGVGGGLFDGERGDLDRWDVDHHVEPGVAGALAGQLALHSVDGQTQLVRRELDTAGAGVSSREVEGGEVNQLGLHTEVQREPRQEGVCGEQSVDGGKTQLRNILPRNCLVAELMSHPAITYSGWGTSRDRKMSSWPIVLFLLLSLGAGLAEELEVNFLISDNIFGSPGDNEDYKRIAVTSCAAYQVKCPRLQPRDPRWAQSWSSRPSCGYRSRCGAPQ